MPNQIKSIQVFGSECPNCKKLFKDAKKAASDLKLDVLVEYVTDVAEMIKQNITSSPVLAINGQPVLTGSGHSEKEIKEVLERECCSEDDCRDEEDKHCGCGCSCC